MQAYVTAPSALALLLPTLAAVLLLVLSKSFGENAPGWSQVTPGAAYWVPALGCLALSLLIAWVWLFVGSSRRDGAFQLRVAWWLSFAFGLAALWCAYRIVTIAKLRLRWRGSALSWQQGGRAFRHELSAAVGVSSTFMGDRACVTFKNGDVLMVDAAAARVFELIEAIEDASGLADPDRPPEH